MECPQCHTENPSGAKFCSNCGSAMAPRCSNCGSDLPKNARFCSNCGQAVNTDNRTDDERLSRLTAATPAPLVQKMRHMRISGERKIVTSVFADVVGSTTLAEQMDAEEWTALMNRAFDCFTPVIYKYEGTIARLLGDAMLAFFGAPVAHEDDPVRAVHAALELLQAARKYAREVRVQYGIDFAIRVGINTGPVVVGDVGSDLKYEYTAMGDAVNLAARLQSLAQPMCALVSASTQRFIAPLFETHDLGLIEVKGKSERVRVYQVLEAKVNRGNVRGLAGLTSPMVGRDTELSTLLQHSPTTNALQGGALAIIGEAGLGKTRLIGEWKEQLMNQLELVPPTLFWAEGHCLSYGQGLAYHLLIDLLRSLIGARDAATEPEVRAALSSRVRGLGDELADDILPYLGHLLSVHLDEAALKRLSAMDPQSLQVQYLLALRALLKTLAAKHPLILILDDIHWVDSSSAEMLTKLLPLANEAPVSFCFVTRPEHDTQGSHLLTVARDTLGAAYTAVELNPLSDQDSRDLVSNLLEIRSLPDQIRATILQKAEGNPFFVEEVIRMLIERGAITLQGNGWVAGKAIDSIEIPDNLQGLLLARIDRLPEDLKRTLRIASVIGRQFPVSVLEQVLQMNP